MRNNTAFNRWASNRCGAELESWSHTSFRVALFPAARCIETPKCCLLRDGINQSIDDSWFLALVSPRRHHLNPKKGLDRGLGIEDAVVSSCT